MLVASVCPSRVIISCYVIEVYFPTECTFRQYIEKHNRGQNRFSKGSIAIKSKQSSNSSSVQNIEGSMGYIS